MPVNPLTARTNNFQQKYDNEYADALSAYGTHFNKIAEARELMLKSENLEQYFIDNNQTTEAEKINGIDLLEQEIRQFLGLSL